MGEGHRAEDSGNFSAPQGLVSLPDSGYAPAGIGDPEYTENAPVAETDLVARLYQRFQRTGWVMPEAQLRIYHAIKESLALAVRNHPEFPKFVWAPKVIDVGCGCGLGSNILSQRADFVWGIDKDERAIHFARQMFARAKNEAYWSPQVCFDVIDVPPSRGSWRNSMSSSRSR